MTMFERGDHAEIADRAIAQMRATDRYVELVSYGGRLYGYRDGVFQVVSDAILGRQIKRFAGELVDDGTEAGRELRVSAGTVAGSVKLVHVELYNAEFFDTAPAGVAFRDSFVRVTADELRAETLSPEHRARHRYGFPFEGEDEPTLFLQFLCDVFRDDADRPEKIAALQELMGAAIAGIAPLYERALLLFGPGANGKTRLVEIIGSTMPPDSVTSLPPARMNDQYALPLLVDALLNTEADLPDDALVHAAKGIISGERTQARIPGNPPFAFRPRCAHVFGCNELPHTKDTTGGFWRRWLIVPMTHNFENDPAKDPHIVSKIVPRELPAIVRWALRGAVRLERQKRYTFPASHELALARWRGIEDGVRLFVETQTRPAGVGEGTLASELHAAYVVWSKSYNQPAKPVEAFGRELTARGYPGARTAKGERYALILARSVGSASRRKKPTHPKPHENSSPGARV